MARRSTAKAGPSANVVAFAGGGHRARAIGGHGTSIYAGYLTDIDHNSEVQGNKWYGTRGTIGIVGKMMRDAHVRRSVEYIVSSLRAADWRFKTAGPDPIDHEIADFCAHAFFERLPWDQILKRKATTYIANGFALSEMTDDLAPISASRFAQHRGGGQAILPTGLHDRPCDTLERWNQSAKNPAQLESVEQWIQGSDGEDSGTRTIPADRLVRMTFDQSGANFAGLAPLRGAYGPWKLKIAFAQIDAIKHERVGLGVPVLTLGADAADEDTDAAEQVLAEMRANEKGYMILPSGYKFEWATTSQNDGTNIAEAIDRCNRDIAVNVAAHFMALGGTERGSYALATSQQGQFHLEVEGHARFICSCLNVGMDGWSPIKRIVRLNYGERAIAPTIEAHNLPTRDWVTVIEKVNDAARAGTIEPDDRLEAMVRDLMNLSPKDHATTRKALGAPAFAPKTQDQK